MIRPSNPRLMARVLDAVTNLGDTKGSSVREVLSFIRRSNVSSKNLTVQVHRALKHAVNAGLLRHRSGRYKVLATLNPTSVPTLTVSKESTNDDRKTEEKKSKSGVRTPIADAESSSRRASERKKRTTSRRQSSGHRGGKARKTSPYPKRPDTSVRNRKRRQRKRAYEDKDENENENENEEFEDPSSGRYISRERNDDSPVPFDRKTKRSRVFERELESDLSDESDANRKRVSRPNKSSHRESKHKETRMKSRDGSASRIPSPPQLLQPTMQARRYPIEEIGNDRQRCEKNRRSAEEDATRNETREKEDIEGARESNDSNGGSTLEKRRTPSRD